jgi:DNA-binding transcriptional ArsR family regulator
VPGERDVEPAGRGVQPGTEPRVEIAEGTAFEVLLAAGAVADADWRQVFATGREDHARALAACGRRFVRQVSVVGRFGWINLVTLLTRSPGPWDLSGLIAAAEACTAEDLHFAAVGGERRQLLEAVDEDVVRAALSGDDAARARLVSAFSSDQNVLDATPWLVTSRSADVRELMVGVLRTWRERLLPHAEEGALAATLHQAAADSRVALAAGSGRDFLARAVGGLHYDPVGLDRVLAVASFRVAPVIVVVDGREDRVVLHPPVGGGQAGHGSADRLLELGRAVGDRTRMRLLTTLRDGEMSAVALAESMGAPRTTLLHHLAILRSAGIVQVTVTPGNATLYRLRPGGFEELSRAAAAFIPSE